MHITKKLAGAVAVALTAALAVPAAGQARSQAPVDTSKTYRITTDFSLALDISGGSRSDGAPLIQWGINGGSNQQWRFEWAPQCICNAYTYRIRNVNSNKCLTAPGGVINPGTKIVQWNCRSHHEQSAGQAWAFYADSAGARRGVLVNGGGVDTGYGFSYFPTLTGPGGGAQWGGQFTLTKGEDWGHNLTLTPLN